MTAPASDGGSALTGYDEHCASAPTSGSNAVADGAAVQTGASPSPADGWVAVSRGTETSPPAASQTISGLSNGQGYRVRVRAKNSLGASGWLAGTGTPASPPTLAPELEAEASQERMIDERVAAKVWELGRVAQ